MLGIDPMDEQTKRDGQKKEAREGVVELEPETALDIQKGMDEVQKEGRDEHHRYMLDALDPNGHGR